MRGIAYRISAAALKAACFSANILIERVLVVKELISVYVYRYFFYFCKNKIIIGGKFWLLLESGFLNLSR